MGKMIRSADMKTNHNREFPPAAPTVSPLAWRCHGETDHSGLGPFLWKVCSKVVAADLKTTLLPSSFRRWRLSH